jgi:hypothetical protein
MKSSFGPPLNFPCLWALAALFHTEFGLLWNHGGPELVSALICGCAALTVLLLPQSTLAFTGLLLTQVYDVYVLLPQCPNHWMLVGLANLTLLTGIAWQTVKQRAWPSLQSVLDSGRFPLQVGIVFFYWWTVVWKLNVDFLSPGSSCAYLFSKGIFDSFLPVLSHPVGLLSPTATLLIEFILPLGLLTNRWRLHSLFGLALFHSMLGMHLNHRLLNFSTVMFALLTLFALEKEPEAYGSTEERAWRLGSITIWIVLIIGSLFAISFRPTFYSIGRFLAWIPLAIWFCLSVFRILKHPPATLESRSPDPVYWLFPVLIMLNGFTPLIGLKTGTSWQMYSNISLNDTTSNHLFLPWSADAMGWMADRIIITDSSSPFLKDYFSGGNAAHSGYTNLQENEAPLEWPVVYVRGFVRRAPGATLTYRYRNVLVHDSPWETDPLFAERDPLWIEKMARFSPTGASGSNNCTW